MYELPHELPNNLKLRKLVNSKKNPEILGFDDKYPAFHPKTKFEDFWQKIAKNQL